MSAKNPLRRRSVERGRRLRLEPLEDRSLLSGWVIGAGGGATIYATDIALGPGGEPHIVGDFSGTADLDPGPGAVEFTSQAYDGYTAKYLADGTLGWARQAPMGTESEDANGIAVDGAGNVYVVGHFSSDPAQFGTEELVTAGYQDAFVAKYNPDGTLAWVKPLAAGTDTGVAQGVTLDSSGDVYVSGYFGGTASFGPYDLTSTGAYDVFLAKLDASDGTIVWAERFGGTGREMALRVTLDPLGEIYIAGMFLDTATFGSYRLTSAGNYDAFVIKVNSTDQSIAWAKRMGGSDRDYVLGLAVDGAGNVLASGYFQETADFGGLSFTSAGDSDAFVSKLDSAGSFLWTRAFGAGGRDRAYGLAIDGDNNALVTGRFTDRIDCDPGPGTQYLSSRGVDDGFLLKLDPAGDYVAAWRMGGEESDQGRTIALDGSGNVYLTGTFGGAADFPEGTLTNQGPADLFVLKMPSDLPLPINDPPAAHPDAYHTALGTRLNVVSEAGVVQNDTDANWDILDALLVTGPSHGTLSFDSDGSFSYRPSAGYSGIDSFTYRVTDMTADSNTATVTIAVGMSPVSLGGAVFEDLNGDGVRDAGEPGMADWTVIRQRPDSPLQVYDMPEPESNHAATYGQTLAAVGNKVLVGSYGYKGGGYNYGGAVYLYDSETGALLRTIVNPTPKTADNFGGALSTLGDDFLVSATGSSEVYLYDSTTGAVLQTYRPPSGHDWNNYSVAGVGDNVLIGYNYSEKAYLFDGTSGALRFTLSKPTREAFSYFGESVAGLGANLLVGNPSDDMAGEDAGAVYLFDGTNGNLLRTFVSPNPKAVEYGRSFGRSIAALGNNVLVGAPRDDTAVADSGAAYLFDGQTGELLQTFVSPYPVSREAFGYYVAAVGGNVLVSHGRAATLFDANTGEVLQTFDVPFDTSTHGLASWDKVLIGTGYQAYIYDNVAMATTDADGAYTFPDVDPGEYILRARTEPDYGQTLPVGGGPHSVLVVGDDDVTGLDFGVRSATAPVAEDDAYATDEDQTLNVSAAGLLANDTDAEGDALTASLVADPSHGSVSVETDGSFTYTPEADFHGSDTFTYRANDGLFDSNEATVTLTVHPVNDAPQASDDTYATDVNAALTPVAPGLLQNDVDVEGDSLVATKLTDPQHALFFQFNDDGSFVYIPQTDYNGPDSFTYRVNDGQADSDAATVTITVGNPRHPGDADLSGWTDLSDFNIWNANKFMQGTAWARGDFNGDSVTDLSDFNIWNAHKFTTAPVPVPLNDVVLAEAAAETLLGQESLLGDLAWLDELERTLADSRAIGQNSLADDAVDKLLATYWD